MKSSSTNCLGVSGPKYEIILITHACHVGSGGTLYQWQELNTAQLSHCQYHTLSVNRHGTMTHDYPANECFLVPLGH